jgi:hypothetical protein
VVYDPYIDDENDPYVAWARENPLALTLPGELSKGTTGEPLPLPPPPPPPPQRMGVLGAPVAEEVPMGAIDAPAPPMQVDAVSAAAPAATVADIASVSTEQRQVPQSDVYGGGQVEGQTPDAYLEHHAALANDQPLPSMREHELAAATERAVYAMSPEQLAQYNAHRDSAMVLEQARLQHEAELENQRRAVEAFQMQQSATAKADADMQDVLARAHDLANSTTNPERYKAQRGTGGTIRDMAMLFFSGLGGNGDGAMRVLDNRIARDIDAQKTAIDNGWKGVDLSRNEIANEYARHGDMYRAAETVRLAKYQSMLNDIQTQMQLYDPAGSSALRGRAAMDQLSAQIEQAKQAMWQQSFKNTIDYMKAEAEYNEKMAAAQKSQAETAKIRGQIGGKATKPLKFEDTPMTLAQLRQLGVPIPPNVAEPPTGLSMNQAKKLAETAKTTEEWNKASRENSPDELNRKLAVGEIFDDQGNPVKFRDETFAGALANTKADVATGVALIDEMIRARNDAGGWTSDLVKSDKWRNAQQAAAAWLLKSKNADQLGVLSGSDLELEMKKLTGGANLTGMRDPIPQLINARSHMLDDLHSKITSQAVLPKGRSIPRWEPPNMAFLEKTTPLVQGKTAVEQGADAHRLLGDVPFLSNMSNKDRMQDAEEHADVGPTGLDRTSDKRVVTAIKDAAAGNADAVQRLADTANASRESVSNAVLARVRAESPDVYKQVVAKLQPDRRAAVEEATKVEPLRLSPTFAFTSLSVDDIATQAHDDPELQRLLFAKAKSGSKAEQKKALEVFSKLTGGAAQ